MLIKYYIRQWTVENSRTKNIVTPYQKHARHVFMLSSDQYLKIAPGAVQYWRLRVDYLIRSSFSPICMKNQPNKFFIMPFLMSVLMTEIPNKMKKKHNNIW